MSLKLIPMRDIRFPKVPGSVTTLYSPGIAADRAERELLDFPRSPKKLKIEHKLENRSDDRLYWRFIAKTSSSKLSLACMREHYRRRWSDSFIKALKKNGFDARGQKLPTSTGGPNDTGLVGTLEVCLYNAVHWEDQTPVKMMQHSENIVKGLMALPKQRSYKNRPSDSAPQRLK